MGGYESLEKEQDIDEERVQTKNLGEKDPPKPEFRNWGFQFGDLSFKVFDKLQDVEKDKNYGKFPLEILHSIFLFVDLKDLLSIFLSCDLFYQISNTTYFWKCYCEQSGVKEMCKFENGKSMNWKRSYFENRWKGCDKYYKFKYSAGNNNQLPSNNDLPMGRGCKIVLLGDSGVGKSSLLVRFMKDRFDEYQQSTIGAAFLCQHLSTSTNSLKLEVWDYASEERYRTVSPMYYRGAEAVLVCFSISDRRSFDRAKQWNKEVCRNAEPYTLQMLVGTKSDLDKKGEREVTVSEASAFAKENGMVGYVETSAKENVNCWVPFGTLTDTLIERDEVFYDGFDRKPYCFQKSETFTLTTAKQDKKNESCGIM